mmetsp:Transcript_81336/g.217513  ORF Transcript_81336/g.217513 Transcript_81336/m.217513 type:complete len:140 (-) Transcript_81336:2-421(-)
MRERGNDNNRYASRGSMLQVPQLTSLARLPPTSAVTGVLFEAGRFAAEARGVTRAKPVWASFPAMTAGEKHVLGTSEAPACRENQWIQMHFNHRGALRSFRKAPMQRPALVAGQVQEGAAHGEDHGGPRGGQEELAMQH